jgi:hypothetical protein
LTLSRRASARLLFAAAVLALPVRYYLGEIESAPVVRLAFFTGVFGSVLLAEGARGMTGLFVGLGAVQLALWLLLLRAGAGLAARGIARIPAPALRSALCVGIAAVMLAAGLTPLYDTPLSSQRPRSSLLQILE